MVRLTVAPSRTDSRGEEGPEDDPKASRVTDPRQRGRERLRPSLPVRGMAAGTTSRGQGVAEEVALLLERGSP